MALVRKGHIAGLSGALVVGALLVFATPSLPGFAGLATPCAEAAEVVYTSTEAGDSGGLPAVEIEVLSDEYDAAVANSLAANVRAAALQVRIDAIERKLPSQQARSDESLRALYKMQGERYDIIEMLLSSQSLEDFVRMSDYIDRINRVNLSALNALTESQDRLATTQAQLSETKAAADERLAAATEALDAARAERAARQTGPDGSSENIDGADWNSTEDEFIAAWAPRIDAYLSGSPLEGQGVNFARSAWRYCIDPRWSAAISNTESSKGRYCIKPHNAWGWGAADEDPSGLALDWPSWEEAIDAHAAGLSKGYGYTITKGGAQTYCPPTWEDWYRHTLDEMLKI